MFNVLKNMLIITRTVMSLNSFSEENLPKTNYLPCCVRARIFLHRKRNCTDALCMERKIKLILHRDRIQNPNEGKKATEGLDHFTSAMLHPCPE